MEKTRIAEKQERDKFLQSMKEDAEYTRRIRQENQETLLRNTETQFKQEMADIKGAAEQAMSFAQAPLDILESIADFSQTAAKAKTEREAAELKRAKAKIEGYKLETLDTDNYEAYVQAQKTSRQAGETLGTEMQVTAIELNEDRIDTLKGHVTNPAFSGEEKRLLDNKYATSYYNQILKERTLDTDRKFVSADGTEYTGIQTSRNHRLLADLQRQTWEDTMIYMGNPDGYYMAEAYQRKELSDKTELNKAYTAEKSVVEARGRDQVDTLYRSNKLDLMTSAFRQNVRMFGTVDAHNTFAKMIADPDIDINLLRQVSPTGSGKYYDEEWPNRWGPALLQRQKNMAERVEAEDRFKKAQDREWQLSNINEIREAYMQNPQGTSKLVLERYNSLGMPVPTVIKNLESEAIKNHEELVTNTINERTRFGTLDLSFVNSIADPTLQKLAREAHQKQELAKYGDEAFGIKKGLVSKARTLTKINPNEDQGSSQTFLVHARLESEYLKQLRLTNDPRLALENINKLVDAGANGDESSPFYVKTGLNNRLVFPNIETSPRERQEMNNYIDKQIIKHGNGVVDRPFTLANADEMDATYSSATTGGIVRYPAGVIRFADQYGFKPSEVYNAQRAANNAATGERKPLLAPSPANVAIDNASPRLRKLFLSDVDQQVERGVVQAKGLLSTRVRPSMGGASFNQAATTNNFISMATTSGAKFPKLVAAQMILESAGGTALSGTNNFFGLKATENESSTAKQTTEFRNGVEGTETANFKNYGSPQESVDDLVSKWYKDYPGYQGVNNANSLEEAARMLQQQGYATDPEYANKLIKIANQL